MKKWIATLACLGLVIAVGCGQKTATNETTSTPAPAASVDGSAYILNDEPEGAKDVIAVREAAKDGDEVLIVGRIGGEEPWNEGRAAFTIVDGSLKACSDIPGDNCQTPWDYCCATDKLPTSTALIKVVDAEGNLIKADARELLGVKELSTVVVKGKAQRIEGGNLIVLASGVHVKKK